MLLLLTISYQPCLRFGVCIVSLQCTNFFMSLFIASIASGSNGNCYYIGNDAEAVFIDAGISCRETEVRMARLGLKMELLKAIFISHEHRDHITGVSLLARRYNIPVYATPGTSHGGRLNLDGDLIFPFLKNEPVLIGGLSVFPFSKLHDAWDPHSFTVSHKGVTVGIFTDCGGICEELKRHFATCHAAFLEANYDDEMLENGNYPYHLKRRISGGKGHLSNAKALELFRKYKSELLTHVLLSHLSKDNNCPDKALQLFKPHAGKVKVSVASRDCESEVFFIENAATSVIASRKNIKSEQLFLF